ncbi:hypothetical protein POM88_033504 [Heracleum sosnowskyi]|uniref:Uncharacterized protein n=1 Tax=Heracleum sosnowskyi TaxID=360622 RepID=A0AAD8ML33_9APIA|nr:hypothetical protein POM88_033504 [Heracleum sosnowskyi]
MTNYEFRSLYAGSKVNHHRRFRGERLGNSTFMSLRDGRYRSAKDSAEEAAVETTGIGMIGDEVEFSRRAFELFKMLGKSISWFILQNTAKDSVEEAAVETIGSGMTGDEVEFSRRAFELFKMSGEEYQLVHPRPDILMSNWR